MRIKLDENIHGDARDALAGWGHDVTTVHEEGLACPAIPTSTSPPR